MSKVLKIVAVVASIAAAAVTLGASLGISAAILTAVSVGASIGASLLAKKPRPPAASPEALNRLRANIDPRTPRKIMIGITASSTDIRDEEFTDSQAYFHRFIVASSHKAESFDEIWFDDKVAWTLAGGVQGEFVGYLTVTPVLEGNAGNAINISARMGSTRRYTGLAYVHLRYKLTGNSKKAESPFAQSITTRITIRGKGAALPDPRDPSQDMADQSTWVWDDDACRNPALALLFYLLGYRINGKLAVGKGIPPERIDLESFEVAANICDEEVATEDGTEPRYRCDGVWSEGDSPTTVIDMLKATMNADLDDVGGKLRLTVFHNDLASPDANFTDDDVLDAFEWRPTPDLDQTFNVLRGSYTDPSDASLYQLVDYPELREDSDDGIDRIFTLDLPLVQSPYQAQRLGQQRLMRQKFGGVFQAEFQATAWAVQKNSVIRLTFAQTGFAEKLFRVAEMEIRQDGVVPLVLREENVAIYAAPTLAAPIEPIAATPYDPTLNPIIQALDTTESVLVATSYVTDADPADGLLQATDTAITVESHSRTYTDKTVSVTGATLTVEDDGVTAISDNTTYHVYYDDPARVGGAVSLKAGLSAQGAATSSANPFRHYVGTIATDVVGGGGTSGGGATPPGWTPGDYIEP